MVNNVLLGLLESVIGKGRPTSKGNYAFKCINPTCPSHTKNKDKLEINLNTTKDNKNYWQCWVCETRGTTIYSLLKYIKAKSSRFQELNNILGTSYKTEVKEEKIIVELPKEFKTFTGSDLGVIKRKALRYLLKDRGITFDDIIKHNIGYCESGRYANKIIIPSYSKKGKVEYFVARSFEQDPYQPIDAPKSDKNIIGFESLINFDLPLIICEGPFDAISVKRNAIPLFGKSISEKLKSKLILNKVKSIYIALDEDAFKKSVYIIEELMNLGKKVYFFKLKEKDPSKIGFVEFTKLAQKLNPLTYMDLMKLKMEL